MTNNTNAIPMTAIQNQYSPLADTPITLSQSVSKFKLDNLQR